MYSPSSDNFEAALGTPLVIIVKTDRIILTYDISCFARSVVMQNPILSQLQKVRWRQLTSLIWLVTTVLFQDLCKQGI